MEFSKIIVYPLIAIVTFFSYFIYAAPIIQENGYSIEVFASVPHPLSLEFGPGGNFGNDLYVGTHRDIGAKIYRVDSNGNDSIFAYLTYEVDGLVFGPGANNDFGEYLYASENFYQISKVDSSGNVSIFSAIDNSRGPIAIDNNGNFGGRLFVAGYVPGSNIHEVDNTGAFSSFAIQAAEGMAFGIGGDWSTDLYVGLVDIYRITPLGSITLFYDGYTANPNLDLGLGLTFDKVGKFENDLFITNRNSIYRITPDKQVSLFISGFENLFGSDGLTFDAEGNMYVADYGANLVYKIAKTEITEPPTLIKLSSFEAKQSGKKVIIKWQTETEVNNLGFNILRSDSEDGEYNKINRKTIKPKGSSTKGAKYKFKDKKVEKGQTYFYKLQDIDSETGATEHGPVSVEVSARKAKK